MASYCEHLDIAYASSTAQLQSFDLHWSEDTQQNRPLVCFVHGGAWIADDKKQHASLARRLVSATGCAVAVPNYRLTSSKDDPGLRHPMHAEDLCAFFHFVIDSAKESRVPYDPERIIVIGHSCSAHIIACILLDSSDPRIVPSPRLLDAVKAVVLTEGIYDLDKLLETFPAYQEWFIEPAFGPPGEGGYRRFSAVEFPPRQRDGESEAAPPKTRWLLLHSKGDTLVDTPQTTAMYAHLKHLYPQNGVVELNTDDLEDEHDALLATDGYVEIVKKFVEGI